MYLTLLSLFFLASSMSCYRYSCDEDQDACAIFSGDLIYMNKEYCNVDEYCKLSSDSASLCTKIYYEDLLPGRKCSHDSQCYSYSCSGNICEGIKEGQTCSSTSSCDIGLFCDETNGVCTKLKDLGDDCEYSIDCSYEYLCYKGVCIEFFSIESGQSISSSYCSESRSNFCSSGQCYSGDSEVICVDAFEYESGDIVSCESDSSCISKSGDYSYQYECSCGFNSNGNSYCDITLGSTYGRNFLGMYKRILKSETIKKSHTAESLLNVLKDWGDESDLETYVFYALGELIYGGLDCAVDMRLYTIFYEGETSLGIILKLGLVFNLF